MNDRNGTINIKEKNWAYGIETFDYSLIPNKPRVQTLNQIHRTDDGNCT